MTDDMNLKVNDEHAIQMVMRSDVAQKMISALCLPRDADGARRWVMSIPARPDYDPDLIISRALADISDLLTDRSRMLTRIEELEAYLDVVKKWEDRIPPDAVTPPEKCGRCIVLAYSVIRCTACSALDCAIELQSLGFDEYEKGK